MTRTGEEAQSEIEIDVDCSRAVDNPAVAERVVAQVTVRVCPVELRCRREFGCGVAASSRIVGWTRTLFARTVGYIAIWLAILLRTGFRTVVVRFVVRAVGYVAVVWTVVVRAVGNIAVVWTVVVRAVGYIAVVRLAVLVVNAALGADITHVVVIVSAGIYAGIVVPTALSCVTVGRRLLVVRSAVLRSGSFPILRTN